VHSPTHGLTIDAICYVNSTWRGIIYEAGRELYKIAKDFHKNNSPENSILLIPHSRGCSYVNNFLQWCPEELRKRIDLRAYAPGAFIESNVCRSIIHYESKWDIVPHIDQAGRKRCQDTIVTLQPHPTAWGIDHEFNSQTYVKSLKEDFDNYLSQ